MAFILGSRRVRPGLTGLAVVLSAGRGNFSRIPGIRRCWRRLCRSPVTNRPDHAARRAANRLQAQLRCVGERGNARLKHWKVLASELRCRPGQCTAMVRAVLALHYMEHDPFAALRAA